MILLTCVCGLPALDSVDRVLQEVEDVGRATGSGDVHEDFISNLNRISQLTGTFICYQGEL